MSLHSKPWISLVLVSVMVQCESATSQMANQRPQVFVAANRDAPAKPANRSPSALPEYVVGEADVLKVNIWKEPDMSEIAVVRPDGNISLPFVNELKVSGLTPSQIQNVIRDQLKTYLTNPQVTVTVVEIHSKKAFITGEVSRPGEYPLNSETTVLQLIAEAGGFTAFAKRNSVVILRVENAQPQRLRFNYREVIQGRKIEQNVALHPGDIVVVP
jgi:polysaccharide export outer membrane protein